MKKKLPIHHLFWDKKEERQVEQKKVDKTEFYSDFFKTKLRYTKSIFRITFYY